MKDAAEEEEEDEKRRRRRGVGDLGESSSSCCL